jgi:hypothetical protein
VLDTKRESRTDVRGPPPGAGIRNNAQDNAIPGQRSERQVMTPERWREIEKLFNELAGRAD